MKAFWKQGLLPAGIVLLGIAGCGMRFGLYAAGLDEKNLLVRGHPLEIALWACSAAAVLLIFLDMWELHGSAEADGNFGRSLICALGHIAAASGIVLTVLSSPQIPGTVSVTVWKLAGLVSAAGLYWTAFCRAAGKRPFFGSYAAGSVFFALHLVYYYQHWCAEPQLQNYVFSFLAALLLMLFAYHQSALCAGGGNSRLQRAVGLLAAYCCLTALGNTADSMLYLSCGIWAVTGVWMPGFRKEEAADGEADGE